MREKVCLLKCSDTRHMVMDNYQSGPQGGGGRYGGDMNG